MRQKPLQPTDVHIGIHIAVHGLDGPVDHQKIAVVDTGVGHRRPVRPAEEGRRRPPHQVGGQVEPAFHRIAGRRGKPGRDPGEQRQPGPPGRDDWAHARRLGVTSRAGDVGVSEHKRNIVAGTVWSQEDDKET